MQLATTNEYIKNARENKGFTLREAAKALLIPYHRLQSLESKRVSMGSLSKYELAKIAVEYDISYIYLCYMGENTYEDFVRRVDEHVELEGNEDLIIAMSSIKHSSTTDNLETFIRENNLDELNASVTLIDLLFQYSKEANRIIDREESTQLRKIRLDELANILRRNREIKKLSLREVASKIGISHTYLSQLESGGSSANIDVLKSIGTYYNLSVFYLAYLSSQRDLLTSALLSNMSLYKQASLENNVKNFLKYLTPSQLKEFINNNVDIVEYTYDKKFDIPSDIMNTIKPLLARDMETLGYTKDHSDDEVAITYSKRFQKQVIVLDDNHEGKFIFTNSKFEPYPDDVQHKLKELIKLYLS